MTALTVYSTDNLLYVVSLVPTKIKFADSITNIPNRGMVAWPDDTIKKSSNCQSLQYKVPGRIFGN